MKRSIPYLILLLTFYTGSLMAQAPDAINYQGIARDASGAPVANQAISLRLSIHATSASGPVEYEETHATTTNNLGLFNVRIGQGTVVSGSFFAITWGSASHFLEVELDPAGGGSYTAIGTTELVSVPYALHARTVEVDQVDDADADPNNELQTLSLSGDSLTLSNGNTVVLSDSVNDADSDPNNELQTLSINLDTLFISNGNSVVLPAGGIDNDWTVAGPDMYNSPQGNVSIGITTFPGKFTVGDTGLFRVFLGHAGNFNEAESGRLAFSEDVLFSGTCGFEFHHDGAANTLSLESGCTTLGDTSIVFTRTGEVRIPERVMVGINSNPSCDIHIKQSSNGTTPSAAGIRFEESTTTTQYQVWTGGGTLNFGFNGTRVATISNAGAYSQISDRRLKTNILPMGSVLASVLALEAVEYNYLHLANGPKVRGFIAQDVQRIFPDMVTASQGTDLLALPYAEFSVVAIKAIQEQQDLIDRQQAEIDALKTQLKRLENLEAAVKALQAE